MRTKETVVTNETEEDWKLCGVKAGGKGKGREREREREREKERGEREGERERQRGMDDCA